MDYLQKAPIEVGEGKILNFFNTFFFFSVINENNTEAPQYYKQR